MQIFSGHLELLLGSDDPEPDNGSQLLDAWASYQKDIDDTRAADDVQLHDEPEPSVLDLYRGSASERHPSSLIARLLLKPDAEKLIDPLLSLVSSPRPADEISEQLADLLGFDDMELVMGILSDRPTIQRGLSEFASRRPADSVLSLNCSPTSLSAEDARKRMERTLRENAARPLFSGTAQPAAEVLPHIYTSSFVAQGNVLSHTGSKYQLPMGTTREYYEDYQEVVVPPTRAVPPRRSERLIPVAELDPLAQGSFPGYTSLNRIQSIVYPTAYQSNENMLICAPTGAGKTDVAMLAILRVLDQHRNAVSGDVLLRSTINRDSFKIIYVAPMKALASEIVRKFSKRLQWLSIQVKELTGDMQLTKTEIAETQVIVTTPEKWDVVTRKVEGEGEIASKLKLLIIDEVHLLNEERGAVIEAIVARTLRQVETSQSVIRIIGLSATLPNYLDVAEFLSVSRYKGLFYFDSSFRPVPLEQHFIGIKGKPGSPQSRKNLDRVSYEKVAELARQGHQVMVFVHARKETVKTAMALKEAAFAQGTLEDFDCSDHTQYTFFRRDIGESRNKEMKQLFDYGFGIHHAGMLRSDRNMMERMFQARAIKVLCCTATLAWGVNLPAHAVIIKGTQVYDSSKGRFVDLSVLDVLQIFGRAGRPGLETSGEGYICTTEDKLVHYLEVVTSQNPIESQFTAGMIDALNAEISLGTVANIHDAVQWIGYTYLFVRMRKNPFQYGIPRDAPADDPNLGNKRSELVTFAARKLADALMITLDTRNGSVASTDLGRIAAKYYIRHSSIEIFNKEFRQKMTEADVLGMLSMSTEFDQVQVRESEIKELERLMEVIPCDVKGGLDTSQGKVNILLQGYISRQPVDDFALVSDTVYAAQNGGRITRALLEIAISSKWASVTATLLGLSQAIEKRLWPTDQPLKQFDLKPDIVYGLDTWAREWSVYDLASQSAADLGKLVHLNEKHGQAILNAARQFPTVLIDYSLRPLCSDVLKIVIQVEPAFTWTSKVHGSTEPFWLWVEDHEGSTIIQISHLVLRPTTESLGVDFVIPIAGGVPPPFVTIRFVSDRWMGAEDEVSIQLDGLIMPPPSKSHSPTLDLPFLSLSSLRNPTVETHFAGRINSFNSLQTHVFWSLMHTQMHTLLCAPSSCGKSLLGLVLVWKTIIEAPADGWVLVLAPRRSVAAEFISELAPSGRVNRVTVELADSALCLRRPRNKTIRVVVASQLFSALSQAGHTASHSLANLRLVVCENLEQIDSSYELSVSLLRHAIRRASTRFVGFSASLNDAEDLASWLGVEPMGLHSFRPSDRDQALSVSAQTFTIPPSAALFKVMAKPAHAAIQAGESAIVFVPSRNQCRTVALNLLTQCALETENAKGYLPYVTSEDRLEYHLARLQDRDGLFDFVSRGIGFFHEGIHKSDRRLMLEMYAEGTIKVLVVPRDSCWSLPVRAAVVVVMGTQYMCVKAEGSERQLRDYSLTELVRMQGRAVRHSASGQFLLFCRAETKDTFTRFLGEGLPLESKLLETPELGVWYAERRKAGDIADKLEAVEALSFTFLARRVGSNPSYYDASDERDETLSRIVDRFEDGIAESS